MLLQYNMATQWTMGTRSDRGCHHLRWESEGYNRHLSSKRRRCCQLVMQLKCFLLLYICSMCLLCSSRPTSRPYRTRRRNNTGFYYGIRDDDMRFHDHCAPRHGIIVPSRFMHGNTLHRKYVTQQDEMIDKLEYLTQYSPSDYSGKHSLRSPETVSVYQNAPPSKMTLGINREKLMRSLSQALMQSLMIPMKHHQLPQYEIGEAATHLRRRSHGIVHSILNRSALAEMNQQEPTQHSIINTASLVKSKPKPSRKKRRKNNTGFYYGLREDVLVLPEKSSIERDMNRSRSTGVLGSIGRQAKSSADMPGQAPRGTKKSLAIDEEIVASDNVNELPASKSDAGIDLKQTDIGQDVIANEKKSNSQKLEAPPIREQVPLEKKAKLDQQKTQSNPSQSKRVEQKKSTKKKRGKTGHHAQSLPLDQSTPGLFDETLQELREMKDEIVALREELRFLKGKLHEGEGFSASEPTLPDGSKDDTDKSRWWGRPPSKETERPAETNDDPLTSLQLERVEEEQQPPSAPEVLKVSPRSRRREFEQIGRDVESWACSLLFDEEKKVGDGWKEISCNSFMKKKLNPDGRTQVYLKWMPDSRNGNEDMTYADNSKSKQELDYPCIKCYSTIDAPMDKVCSFLANENTIPVYNELVEDHCDIEEITPHSKITWCKMPKVMFVKPRDFVTFCSHRWWKDGTQVIVNQACEHEDMPGVLIEGEGDVCRGYALRGANFISKDPDDPNKTRITLLAHANPGGGLPQWAMTTAVNAVVQIEPFKLFHNINEGVSAYNEPPPPMPSGPQLATINSLPGRSNKPAGMAQMGYACFWPKGGGLNEKQLEENTADVNVPLE